MKELNLNPNYSKVKLHNIKSNHYKIVARINNTKGWFIVDTGASNTFIDNKSIEKFKLKYADQNINAQGAGPNKIKAKVYKKNSIVIGSFKFKKAEIATIDLSYVNNALVKANLKEIDGVIGSDILKIGKAIIDFNNNYIYVKKVFH